MVTGAYALLHDRLLKIFPEDRLIHDDLHTLAFGTDASFYRLIPKLVIKVENERDVINILREAGSLRLPLTFRAGGTSLSGQAISDSILVVLGSSWTGHSISDDASTIRLQPGVIGAHANVYLAPHGKKIGPDPASINSAMIGGIAANNSSGMCCGTAQNSYKTLAGMRVILADGTVLDTRDDDSTKTFRETHANLISQVSRLSLRVKGNQPLAERIRNKFKMKNTTGYSLNALVDFDDPIEIIQHLMIGSEGTLGFIAEVTYNTVPELPHKASSLMLFPDIETACRAVIILKTCNVDAVELMDRASLRSVESKPGMPEYLRHLDQEAASLLVETRAVDAATLDDHIRKTSEALSPLNKLRPIEFTAVPAEFTRLWNIRKGLFPSVGAMRETGTTVIIEDVAFPVPRLAEATLDLQLLLRKHGYHDAIIFGHALDGNLHFVFHQDFSSVSEVRRYESFIADVTAMVVKKYDGSLKAEHGTGRNMAPFVELEWGAEAFELMKEIKGIFDPENLLNPGVILNADKQAHIKNLKPLPAADPIIDKCIECGFCEVHCPSKDLTITPRQRIAVYREIARLMTSREDEQRLTLLRTSFAYQGDRTCATDGLCATSCPVGIDTGKLIKELRFRTNSPTAVNIATTLADNMGAVTAGLRIMLNLVHVIHTILGTSLMRRTSSLARKMSGNNLPLWNPYMPKGADPLVTHTSRNPARPTVVYFPTCINRVMGRSRGDAGEQSLTTTVAALLEKAGYNIVHPGGLPHLCCGMAFASKGFKTQGDGKAEELERALIEASEGGTYPVLVDMSPCLYRMKETFTSGLMVYEPIQFTAEFLVERLNFQHIPETIAIHNTCSSIKMGLDSSFLRLAELCAEHVIVPHGIECCGWAGDRGFTVPELNASALKSLKSKIPPECHQGYSTSRTCEIGLSMHSGIHYQSILYLVDKCTTSKEQTQNSTASERYAHS